MCCLVLILLLSLVSFPTPGLSFSDQLALFPLSPGQSPSVPSRLCVCKDQKSGPSFVRPLHSLLPLLFILYINDLQNVSQNIKLLLYADDTAIFFQSKNIESLQNVIDTESAHITDQTVYQLYTKSAIKLNINVRLNGRKIREETKVRYLGVYIDANLNWLPHIHHLSIILSKNIGIINRSKYFLNKHSLLLLYNALVLPHISYCCLIWGFTYPSYLKKIETLQKRVVRTIDYQDRLAHSDPIFNNLNILKVKDPLVT